MDENTEQPTVNVPLLRKAVEWAEAEAAKGESSLWRQDDYVQATTCGTAYCIAGWTLHQAGYSDSDISDCDEVLAADLLGIPAWDFSAEAGSHLFADHNTIEDVRRIAESLAGERL